MKTEELEWKVNTGNLLREILNNKGAAILRQPLQIFQDLIRQVGERAIELNDPKLNALMCRLSIYSVSDPYSPDYDVKVVDKVLKKAKNKTLKNNSK